MGVNRREFLRAAAVGLCLGTLNGMLSSCKPSSRKPNIILCMADDQGWGDAAIEFIQRHQRTQQTVDEAAP